jgi:hypothetical protein
MDNLYKILLFVHIVGIALWFGGGLFTSLFINGARKRETTKEMAPIALVAKTNGPIFGLNSLTVLITGCILVGHYDAWAFKDLWVSLGLAGYLISAATGGGYFRKAGQQLGGFLAADDVSGARVKMDQIVMVARMDMLVLLLVILDMVWKPGS